MATRVESPGPAILIPMGPPRQSRLSLAGGFAFAQILLAQQALRGLSRGSNPSYPLYSCYGYKVCTEIHVLWCVCAPLSSVHLL